MLIFRGYGDGGRWAHVRRYGWQARHGRSCLTQPGLLHSLLCLRAGRACVPALLPNGGVMLLVLQRALKTRGKLGSCLTSSSTSCKLLSAFSVYCGNAFVPRHSWPGLPFLILLHPRAADASCPCLLFASLRSPTPPPQMPFIPAPPFPINEPPPTQSTQESRIMKQVFRIMRPKANHGLHRQLLPVNEYTRSLRPSSAAPVGAETKLIDEERNVVVLVGRLDLLPSILVGQDTRQAPPAYLTDDRVKASLMRRNLHANSHQHLTSSSATCLT